MSLRQPKPVVFRGLRRTNDTSSIPFDINCVCGASIRGLRQAQAQAVACPSCGAKRFVLPRSPLPEVVMSLDTSRAATNRKAFRVIVVVAALTAAVAGAVGIWLAWVSGNPGTEVRPLSDEEQYQQHLMAGRTALAEGSWHKAARELDAALQVDARVQGRLAKDDKREIRQQQRQAAIVADLLTESLSEVGRHSLGLPNEEWQQVFRERYAGRSFIIDDVIHRDAAQKKLHYRFKYVLQNAEMKLDLARVKILDTQVLLNQPQRILVGLRLASIRREPSGWVVELDPEGGVWLTDEAVLGGLSIPINAELREVLKRQRTWLRD
jgi:DNA-directed RNA polymerase subunit RPC12/RpoP